MSSESRPRRRNKSNKPKRGSPVLEEAPRHTIEYERLNLTESVPRICTSINDESSICSLEDLDRYQEELEILITDATKRMRLLRNESKTINPKLLRQHEETLKKLKDSNYERYQQSMNFTAKKTNMPKADIIENILKAQISPPSLNDDSVPSRFWNFAQSYDLKVSDLNPLTDYVKSSIPFHQTSDDTTADANDESTPEIETKDLLKVAMRNIQDAPASKRKHKNKSPKLGPYTQRLISSFVTSDDESNTEPAKELQSFLERSKPSTQLQANAIEKAVLRDLMQANLANDPKVCDSDQGTANCSTLGKLECILDKQCSGNQKKMEMLLLLGKSEVAKKQMQTAIRYLQIDIIKTYKNMLVAKQETGTVDPADVSHFENILSKKSRYTAFMKTL